MEQLVQFLPLVAIALLFWLLVVRPASRRQKAIAKQQAELQPGQQVMLTSGIFGTVEALLDDRIRLEIAPGIQIEVARARDRHRRPPGRHGRHATRPTGPTAPWPTTSPSSADMAKRKPNPGRTLVVFFLVVALSYGLVALAGVWKPKLGLDLQGGTRITLIAKGDVSSDSLSEARGIIEDRVNGSGVAEAEVSTQGNKYVVVEIPGESRRDLVETVKRQAQLRFRVVAAVADGSATGAGAPAPARRHRRRDGPRHRHGHRHPGQQPGALRLGRREAPDRTRRSTTTTSPSPSESPATETPTEPPTEQPATGGGDDDPLVWMDNPDAARSRPSTSSPARRPASPPPSTTTPTSRWSPATQFGQKYLLSTTLIEGTDLTPPTPCRPASRASSGSSSSTSTAPAPRSSRASPRRWSTPRSCSRSCSTAR